jgi:ubiquinone/menaquinone biosynthesis C-methylase UbiE
LLAAAGLTVGQTVLDVAAGTGGLAVMAASRVGPSGRVIATDISLPMLHVAKGEIAGLPVDLVVSDGQDLACRDRSFDVVTCQLGLMFFPDALRGLREFRRVLRGGGRLAIQVWSRPDRVPFFGIVADALSRYYPKQRDILYLSSALADPDHLHGLLADAGFGDVSVVAATREVAFDSFDQYWSAIEAGAGGNLRGCVNE